MTWWLLVWRWLLTALFGRINPMAGTWNRIRYWLRAQRCTCRGYPRRFAGGTVQLDGILHRTDAPCFECDTYGQPI